MENIKEKIKKYRVILLFVVVLCASFCIYMYVSADEDIYENKVSVTNATITNIIDGTANSDENFDANDEAGNDSSNNNKKVRSFDSVTYQVSYGLAYKDSSLTDLTVKRNVIVDVLVPNSIKANVSSDGMNIVEPSQEQINGYTYYSYEVSEAEMSQTNNLEVILLNIIADNGVKFTPIIRVREATDSDVTAITSSTDTSSIADKISNVDEIEVSAKENYKVRLYGSNPVKGENKSEFNTGVLIYLPSDSNKGIKGIQMPSSASFNIVVESSEDSTYTTINDASGKYKIVNYTQSQSEIAGLPYAFIQDEHSENNENGIATIDEQNTTLNNNKVSTFKIDVSNLMYHNIEPMQIVNEQGIYISSLLFKFETVKTNEVQQQRKNLNYVVSTTPVYFEDGALNLTDNYDPFVGEYTSSVEFTKDPNFIVFDEHGKSVYNYKEEFYIQNTTRYGYESGDTLSNGITNYIKIDNEAFKVVNYGNSDEALDYYLSFNNNNVENYNPTSEVKFGLGEWNSDYFEVNTDKPSYCPSSMEGLTKEQIMDYYGGPCIKEKNTVKWVNTIAEAQDEGKEDKIIIFKLNVTGSYETHSTATTRLKVIAVDNTHNIHNTFAVVARGKTTFNNSDYYLSEKPRVSVWNQTADLRHQKAEYDIGTHEITSYDKSYVDNTEAANNIGNTALISAFKSSIRDVKIIDVYGGEKEVFYSGINDPITIEIKPSVYKTDSNAVIDKSTISVYLPVELELYKMNGDKAYNEETSGALTTDGKYKIYNYDYTSDDINGSGDSSAGTIPTLTLHAYINISTADSTNVELISTIESQSSRPSVYTDVTPAESRTNRTSILLRNTKKVNIIGKTNVNRIDENGSYIYNMKALNMSGADAKLSLLYILPYSGDNVGDGSKFSGTVGIYLENELPSGYTAFSTSDNVATILSNELSDNSSVQWQPWSNNTQPKAGFTAIKIVPTSTIPNNGYFVSQEGVNVVIKTNGNKEAEKYMNKFYILNSDVDIPIYDDIESDEHTTRRGTESYASNVADVSVYNRTISGYVFIDANYNGLYDKDSEPRVKDIAVELYKLSAEDISDDDRYNPKEVISANDELIKDSSTNNDGYYKFEDLKSGNYYVKYKFNCTKYTIAEKNKIQLGMDTSDIDSDAQLIKENDTCYAVSNIQKLNNEKLEVKYIDLGIRVRQEFGIKLNKYITNVTVSTPTGTDSYDYDRQSKVKVDVRNLKTATLRVTYLIEIENTKYFPGTVGNLIESIPDGMTFDPNLEANEGWYENDGKLYYANLSKTIMMPGEKYYIKIALDLVTSTGGDYINFVVANDLQIAPVTTEFVEFPNAEYNEEGK